MKTKIYVTLLFIALIAIGPMNAQNLVTTKPSIEGRASVADEGVLPQGLFAKSSLFLPGDSVTVTNPATGITLNVMILGPSESANGTAIQLAPEAAVRLFLAKGTETLVSMTKKMVAPSNSPPLAPNSYRHTSDPDRYPEDAIPRNLEAKLTPVESPPPEVPDAKNDLPPSLSAGDAYRNPPTWPGLPLNDEPRLAVDDSRNNTPSTALSAPVNNRPSTAPGAPVNNKPINSEVRTDSFNDSVKIADARPIPFNDSAKTTDVRPIPFNNPAKIAGASSTPYTDLAKTPVASSTPYSDFVKITDVHPVYSNDSAKAIEVRPAPYQEPVKDPEMRSAPYREPVKDPEMRSVPYKEPVKAPEMRSAPYQELAKDPEMRSAPYQEPVKAPEMRSAPFKDPGEAAVPPTPKVSGEKEITVIGLKQTSPEPPPRSEVTAAPPLRTPIPAAKPLFTDLIVSEDRLNRGYYYVQIATMSDERNIDFLLSKYRDRYNFAIVPSQVNASSYRVLVGPLTADEYGVVLSRFQGSGYGDAFVKQIK